MAALGPSFPAELAAAGLTSTLFDVNPATGAVTDHGLPPEDRAKLDAVLAAHDALRSTLRDYAEKKHARVRDGGIRVDVGGGEKADVASNDSGRGLVSGCVGLIDLAEKVGAPAPTFPWVNDDGTKLTLTAAQIQTIALALGQFIQAAYGALGTVYADIVSGTITTTAQIEAAAWPATTATVS